MIKIERAVFPSPMQLEFVVRAVRHPYESYDKSDSKMKQYWFDVGEADLALMSKLSKAGNDHGKYLRMMPVMCEITAPLTWWKQMDQYKVGTVTSSTSTMHSIHKKEFDLSDFDTDHMSGESISVFKDVMVELNKDRKLYNETQGITYWNDMINLLPESYLQLRSWCGNYQVLKDIYHARLNHKLGCWHDFCAWIRDKVPYSKELIIGEGK